MPSQHNGLSYDQLLYSAIDPEEANDVGGNIDFAVTIFLCLLPEVAE